MFNNEADLTETARIANLPMRDLVYGPAPRRVRLPLRLIFMAAFLGATIGCATAPKPVAEVETVGTLSASYHGIASAPIHASTDLTPSFGAVDTDEDAPKTTEHVVGDVEAPEIAPKTDGVTVGGVR